MTIIYIIFTYLVISAIIDGICKHLNLSESTTAIFLLWPFIIMASPFILISFITRIILDKSSLKYFKIIKRKDKSSNIRYKIYQRKYFIFNKFICTFDSVDESVSYIKNNFGDDAKITYNN